MNASSQLPVERSSPPTVRRYERPALADRDKDLRQLIRLAGLAKTGQPKSVLTCGDAGIGKTALLDAFCDAIRERYFCRLVDLRACQPESVEQLYIAFIDALQTEAGAIFDEALEAVNEILAPLGLRWERPDLARAVALVKLQESIGGKQALSQESLVKAIRSAVALPSKKLRGAALADVIEQLVHIIVNPWLLVAVNLTQPLTPTLREAVEMARRLRSGESIEAAQKAIERARRASDAGSGDTAMDHHLDQLHTPARSTPGGRHDDAIHLLAAAPESLSDDATALHFALPVAASPSPAPAGVAYEAEDDALAGRDALGIETLTRHLMNALLFVNKAIESLDSALIIALDSWERVLSLPERRRDDLKDFLASLLRETLDAPNCHLMLALACRSEGQSESLGGPLYSLFRNKLLLADIQERPRRALFLAPFREQGVELEDAVLSAAFRLTQGNPLWLLKLRHVILERALANGVDRVDMAFFRRLGVERREDVWQASLTRLELAFLNQEDALYRVIAGLLRQFGEDPFEAPAAIVELSASQGVSELLAAEALRHLYLHDFLAECPPGNAEGPPRYRVQSRQALAFLEEKTREVPVDVSTHEKIAYLRKIIPLSIQSGELDREKTREVLQLCAAMNDFEMAGFLETSFLAFIHDEKPMTRLSALNNLAVLESKPALGAILEAVSDADAIVREYAVRNLAAMARKPWDAATHEAIVSALIAAIDDESDAVRSQVYLALSRYQWNRDLTAVFIKGLADGCDAVRVTAITALSEIESDAPLVRATFLDACDDRLADVRRLAVRGLQRFEGDDIIHRLVAMLREEPESALRAAVADALSAMNSDAAREALMQALTDDPDEDVKITIVRALGGRRGWTSESCLLQLLRPQDGSPGGDALETDSPGLLWACVRALGQAGATPQSLQTLHGLRARTRNEIIRLAIDVAIRRISDRVEEMRQFERQFHSALPLVVAEAEPPPDPDADLPPIEEDIS